jgi:HPt (histidine-containing phosphotransfer) domain-containing protein
MIALIESLAAGAAAVTAPPAPIEPVSPPTAVVFDPELARKRCLNKPDLLQQMMAFVFKDLDNFLPQLRAALQKGDLVEVGRLGHRLKGTVIHVGGEAAREAASRVELLHAGEQAEAEEAVTAFERECGALKAALIEYQAMTGSMQNGQ